MATTSKRLVISSSRRIIISGLSFSSSSSSSRVVPRLLLLPPPSQRLNIAPAGLLQRGLPAMVAGQQCRLMSSSGSSSQETEGGALGVKEYDFEKVKKLIDSPSKDTILIDVREPSEFQHGAIPTAINLPLQSHPDSLTLDEDAFAARFGFAKPPPHAQVVFYCKMGVRSAKAARLARENGYTRVGDYRGSWADWSARTGSG